MSGFYYLHTNGDLIWKKFRPEDDSGFVKRIWPVDTTDRADAWKIILESFALGARFKRLQELIKKWNCDIKDLAEYMVRNLKPTDLEKEGICLYLEKINKCNPEKWFEWLGKTPKEKEPDWETMPKGE